MLQPNHAGLAFVSPTPPEVTLRHFELWRESVAESRPIVELERAPDNQPDGSPAYILTIIGRERKRLLADLTKVLHQIGLETMSARIFTMPNQSVMDLFTLKDPERVLDDDTVVATVHDALFRLVGATAESTDAYFAPSAAASNAPEENMDNLHRISLSDRSSVANDVVSNASGLYRSFTTNLASSVDEEREDQVKQIALLKPVGSSLAHRSFRRCLSNIAVADLDHTLQEQQTQAASHPLTLQVTDTGSDLDVDLGLLKTGEWLLFYSPESKLRYRFKFQLSDDEKYLIWEGRTLRLSACVGVLYGPLSNTFLDLGNSRVDPDWLCFSLVLFPRGGVKYGPTKPERGPDGDSISGPNTSLSEQGTFMRQSSHIQVSARGSVDQHPLDFAIASNRSNSDMEYPKGTEPMTVDLVCETDAQLTTWLFGLQKLCGAPLSRRPLYSYEALLKQRVKYKLRTRAHDRGLTTRAYILKKVRKLAAKEAHKGEVERHELEINELESEVERLRKELRTASRRETVLATKLHDLQQNWDIEFKELNLIEIIGRGAFSEMWRAEWRRSPVAVKVLKLPNSLAGPSVDLMANPRQSSGLNISHDNQFASGTPTEQTNNDSEQEFLHMFHMEVNALSALRHPNIVLFMGASLQPPSLCIVTEFLHGGNLYSALRKKSWRENMGHAEFVRIARDAARGLLYLHEERIIHRDLKSQNILLDRPVESGCPILKIADFGLSRQFNGALGSSRVGESDVGVMTSETGTYRWMAPEVIRHEKYNEKVDVYSYGITLWELFTCETPFSGLTPIQAAFAVADKDLRPSPVSDVGRSVSIPRAWDALIGKCWSAKPHERPRFADVLLVLDEMEAKGPNELPTQWRSLEKRRDVANLLESDQGRAKAIGRSRDLMERLDEPNPIMYVQEPHHTTQQPPDLFSGKDKSSSGIIQRAFGKIKNAASGTGLFCGSRSENSKSVQDGQADSWSKQGKTKTSAEVPELETRPFAAGSQDFAVPSMKSVFEKSLNRFDWDKSEAIVAISDRQNKSEGKGKEAESAPSDAKPWTGLRRSGSAPNLICREHKLS